MSFGITGFQIRAEAGMATCIDVTFVDMGGELMSALRGLVFSKDQEGVDDVLTKQLTSTHVKFRPCCPYCGVPYDPYQASGKCIECGATLGG